MNVFITGGSTGIGFELAKIYLRSGVRVGVCSRNRDVFIESTKSLDQTFKNNLHYYAADVSDLESLSRAFSEFTQEGKLKLDLVVANAGIATGPKFINPNFSKLRRIIDINIIGVLNTFEVAFKYMVAQKSGQIYVISSLASFNGLPGSSAYCASKSAVNRLCETFAIDFKKLGIHVGSICPGFIDTELTKVNKHVMPLKMSAEKAAHKIYNAMQLRKSMYAFPLPMYLLVRILSFLPRSWYIALMSLRVVKYAEQ